MKVKVFKNGNINVKREKEDNINSFYEFLEQLCLQCDFMTYEDTETIQHNEYCLGNDCIAYDMYYNGNPSILYIVSSHDYKIFMNDQTIKLEANDNSLEIDEV